MSVCSFEWFAIISISILCAVSDLYFTQRGVDVGKALMDGIMYSSSKKSHSLRSSPQLLLHDHFYPSYAMDSECMPVCACVLVPWIWSHYRMSAAVVS